MNKANVIATLNSLPEKFKTEELIEKLLFIDKAEKSQPKADTNANEEKEQPFNFSLN